MKKKLASAQRILIENISFFIGADMHSVNINLSILRSRTKDSFTLHFPMRRDLTSVPARRDSSLISILDKIIVKGLFIICNQFDSLVYLLP